MDVNQIHVVGPQPFQACLEAAQEFVAGAIGNLRCQPNVFAARSHHPANASFAFAVSVSVSRVQICDAQINRVIEDRRGTLCVLVHKEAAAAAESKNRHLGAGSSQSPRGNKIGARACAANIVQ